MWIQHANRYETEKRYSIKSKIFLIFIGYTVFNSLFDSIVNHLSTYNLHENQWQKSVITSHQQHNKFSFSSPKYNLMINGTLLSSDDNVEYNKISQSWFPLNSWLPHELKLLATAIVKTKRLWPIGGALLAQVEAIRLVRLEAPNYVEAGQPVKLRCIYETKGDKLQSLAWYKNGHEFYRYQPFERRQPVLAFNYTGVNVDLNKSRNSTVVLTNTTNETSGRYKCEVTATTFQEVNMETYVTVTTPTSDAAVSSREITYTNSHIISLTTLVVAACFYTNTIYHIKHKHQ